jgi:hypothetical protein
VEPALHREVNALVDRSGREAPLTGPKHAATAGISRHRRAARTLLLIPQRNSKPKAADVRLGLTDGTSTEVVSGLSEGTEVIIGTADARAGTAGGPGGGLPRGCFF